jgi:GAF domain-containing protein
LQVVARFEDGVKVIDLLAHPPEMPVENTPAGQVWETRKLLIISDLSQEPVLRHPFRDNLRSLLTTPVLARGLALGMVEVGSFTPHAYDENDVAVFQQMVAQLSVTIENAEAYAQSQEMAKNKALASEIAAHLQQQTDIESILSVTMTELGKALGAKQGRIRMGTDYIGDSQP